MPHFSYDYPNIENSELLATYARTSPQLYSSIATSDKYLLRYASNTWNIQIPHCVFHPELNAIRLPIPFFSAHKTLVLDIPYQAITSLGFQQHPDPYTNTITLECICEVYLLAENILIRLPTTSSLKSIYPELPDDGITFTLPYLDIQSNKIKDNLTRLSLTVRDSISSALSLIVLYPLQRYPPQPLSSGVFQPYSNLTPLQSLQLVNDEIIQGMDLAKNMLEYIKNMRNQATRSSSLTPDITGSPSLYSNPEIMLSQSGYGDDDEYQQFDYSNYGSTKLDTMGSMSVEVIGGFNAAGVKRSRRESDDTINETKHKKI